MPPNSGSDCVLRKRQKSIEEETDTCDNGINAACKDKSDVQLDKDKRRSRSVCFKFGVTVLVSFTVLAIAFLVIPWEDWLVTEDELEEYLKQYATQSSENANVEGEYYTFLATSEQHFTEISLHEVNCSEKGYRREREIGGAPQRCGTLIYDNLVTVEEASKLRKLAEKLINRIGDSSRYIRESLNLKWVNLHNVFRKGAQLKIFTEKDYKLIRKTGDAVKQVVCNTFGLREELVFFSNVSQFTRHKPVTQFSEFRHVDKVRSPSLIVTTILWLSTVDFDFIGGRLEFLTGGPEPFSPLLIDPKFGRFSAWTSSYENPHAVHEIVAGERYALIFAFTASQEIGHASIDHLREWAFSFDELNLV